MFSVFGAIQPPRRDATRIGDHGRISPFELCLQELDQRVDLLGRPIHFLGRHLVELNLVPDQFPLLGRSCECIHVVERRNVEVAGELRVVVALGARVQ